MGRVRVWVGGVATVVGLLGGGSEAVALKLPMLAVELVVENRNWQDLDYLRGVRTPRNVMPAYSFPRVQEPVTSGVPLPLSAEIRSVDQLALFSAHGKSEIPAQFKVLARHQAPVEVATAPITVVLVDFQADVPAGGEARYVLKAVGRPSRREPTLATEGRDAISIDTGPLQLTIRKQRGFSLFDEVRLKTDRGVQTVVAPGSPGGIEIRYQGRVFSSALEPAEVKLEENGRLRAVVTARGKLRSQPLMGLIPSSLLTPPGAKNPLSYTVRLTAFRGKPHLKVAVRLENENRGWGTGPSDAPLGIYLDSVDLVSSVALTGEPRVTTQGWQGSGEGVVFEQRWQNLNPQDESANFSYRILKAGQEVAATVGRADGWITVADGGKGVTLVRRFFWQEHPATLEVNRHALRAGLLPLGRCNDECRNGAYRFWGGYHKTFELIYEFHGAARAPEDLAGLLAFAKSPLFAKASPDWYVRSGVFGPLAPFGLKGVDAASDNALRGREGWARVKYDRTYDANHLGTKDSLYTYRERRPISMGGQARPENHSPYYGWERFGEIYSYQGALSQDYGWSGWLLASFLESGDLEFLNLGLEFAGHHADIDVVHDPHTVPNSKDWLGTLNHGAQRYENDAHNRVSPGTLTGAVSGTSHAWSKGEMVAYFLTGDPRFRESVEAQAEHAQRAHIMFDRRKTIETRQQGWGILLMLNAYRSSGVAMWLDGSVRVFREGILEREREAPQGFSGYTSQRVWARWSQLTEAIGPNDVTLKTDNWDMRFPEQGVIKVGDEEIVYGKAEGPVLRHLKRGHNGTAPASHPKHTPVVLIATDDRSWERVATINVAVAHLFYDLIIGTTLVELHDVLVEAGRASDAKEVREFLLRMAVFLRDRVMASYIKPLGSLDAKGMYYPFSIPYIYRADVRVASMHPPHGLYASDIFAFAFRVTSDINWLTLARDVYTDSLNYYVQVGWFNPFTQPRPRVGYSLVWMLPTQTWAKFYAYPFNGQYYLHTEFLGQRQKGS